MSEPRRSTAVQDYLVGVLSLLTCFTIWIPYAVSEYRLARHFTEKLVRRAAT